LDYKLFDTSSVYRNQKDIGKVLKELNISRENVFIVSKFGPSEHGFEKARQACLKALDELGINFIDLYLVHWPGAQGYSHDSDVNARLRKESWSALEQLYDEGKCRAIGVSNYTVRHLNELLSYCRILPTVNQVEYHPKQQQKELLLLCKEKKIYF